MFACTLHLVLTLCSEKIGYHQHHRKKLERFSRSLPTSPERGQRCKDKCEILPIIISVSPSFFLTVALCFSPLHSTCSTPASLKPRGARNQATIVFVSRRGTPGGGR